MTIDLSILEHKLFFNELHSMCDADDSLLLKLHCYKNVTTFVPLRKSAISTCHCYCSFLFCGCCVVTGHMGGMLS